MLSILANEISFKGQAPSLNCIVDKVVELSGLDVSIEDQPDSYYDFNACLTFGDFPDNKLEIYSERKKNSWDSNISIEYTVERSFVQTDTQTFIYLRMYSAQETTLFLVTALALEQLGGDLKHPFSEDIKQQYLANLTSTELNRRSARNTISILYSYMLTILFLPVLIPYWIITTMLFMRNVEDIRTNPDKYLED